MDPFAGSGISSLITSITGSNISYGLDLLPMIDIFTEYFYEVLNYGERILSEIHRDIKSLINEEKISVYKDIDERILSWYPESVAKILRKIWGYYHREIAYFDKNRLTWISYKKDFPWGLYTILLLRISRKFSYADDSVAKYFRSKMKKAKLDKMISSFSIKDLFLKDVNSVIRRLKELKVYNFSKPVTRGFFDVLEHEFETSDLECVITSPPYLIAHEYVRSFKLDLYWLDVPPELIVWLKKHEIPYRGYVYNVRSKLYEEYREKIKERDKKDLLRYYDNYFMSLSKAFDKIATIIKQEGILIIVLADATLGSHKIPIGEILAEHLTNNDNRLVLFEDFIDKIRKRKLFKKRLNNNPNGITYEKIYIFKKSSSI